MEPDPLRPCPAFVPLFPISEGQHRVGVTPQKEKPGAYTLRTPRLGEVPVIMGDTKIN